MPSLKVCESIVQQINAAIKNFSFYPKGHAYVAQPIRKSFDALVEIYKEAGELNIALVDDIIWVQNIPIPQEAMWDSVKKILKNCHKDSVRIRKGVELPEWEHFVVSMAAAEKEKTIENDNFSTHITFHSIEKDADDKPHRVYSEAVEVVQSVISEVRMGKIPKPGGVKNVVDKMMGQVLKDKYAMTALTVIKSYDNYLFNHSVNVSILSVALGTSLELRSDLLRDMGISAMLHDIGKVNIDSKIVLKPDKLTDAEWAKMKEHPIIGHDIISQMDGLSDVVRTVAREHHVKYDMTGYPDVPKDHKLHPASMILSICDCYDAMTTHRVYQRCYEPRETLEFMQKMSGTSFEPNYLKSFIKMLGIYPQGTLVKLSTGETGIVSVPNPKSPDEPVVKVVYDLFGNKYEKVRLVDLSKKPVDEDSKTPITILSTVNPTWGDINLGEYMGKD